IIYGLISWIRQIEMVVNGALLINIFVTIVSCVIYYVVVLALVKDEIFYDVINAVKNKVLKRG
ncbi:MAG: lipopolysaccharide biosynthesis protein, partial [Granulicatella sp.]